MSDRTSTLREILPRPSSNPDEIASEEERKAFVQRVSRTVADSEDDSSNLLMASVFASVTIGLTLNTETNHFCAGYVLSAEEDKGLTIVDNLVLSYEDPKDALTSYIQLNDHFVSAQTAHILEGTETGRELVEMIERQGAKIAVQGVHGLKVIESGEGLMRGLLRVLGSIVTGVSMEKYEESKQDEIAEDGGVWYASGSSDRPC
jgi:hypothetical protein